MASKTTLNAKNLEALGSERLAVLLMEISTGSAASKRRLRIELAGMQSSGEVAREVAKRLSTIDRTNSKVGGRRVKALRSDLDTQRRVIVEKIAESDADEALEMIWRFMGVAQSVFDRCADNNGTILAVFRQACADLGAIAQKAEATPCALAERVMSALQHNDYGQYDTLLVELAPALGADGLDHLRTLFVQWSQQGDQAKGARESYEDILNLRKRDRTIRTALEQIADAQGDVDAFIALNDEQARQDPAVAAEIAARLLKSGRKEEALNALNVANISDRNKVPVEWEDVYIEVLEEFDRKDDAQKFRIQSFERTLNACHLKAYLKRLPDFDDMEAEEKAIAFAGSYKDVHEALAFLLSWPAPDEAARVAVSRAAELDGDRFEFLTSAAESLRDTNPLASVVILRAMVDFVLDRARAARYRHTVRNLAEAKRFASEIKDWRTVKSHEEYVADLKSRHRSKTRFWKRAG